MGSSERTRNTSHLVCLQVVLHPTLECPAEGHPQVMSQRVLTGCGELPAPEEITRAFVRSNLGIMGANSVLENIRNVTVDAFPRSLCVTSHCVLCCFTFCVVFRCFDDNCTISIFKKDTLKICTLGDCE